MTKMESARKRILIVLPRQLGDILLGSSMAFALRENLPDAHIAWLAHPMGRQLLTGHPALNAVHYYPNWKGRSLVSVIRNPVEFLQALLKHVVAEISFLAEIRKQKFDHVVDVICTPRTATLTRWSGASMRIGLKTRWNRNWAYSLLCSPQNWGSQYAAQARLDLLVPILGDQFKKTRATKNLTPWVARTPEILLRVSEVLKSMDLKEQRFAVLSPTNRRDLRCWPAASFVALAFQLVSEMGWRIVWMWGPGEFEIVEKMHSQLRVRLRDANLDESFSTLPPLLNLPEVAAFAEHAEIWIGNSNGLAHIAVAGGAKTIQIHGPTSFIPWTHPDVSKHTSVQRSEGCVRCESNVCRAKTHECMKDLDVGTVFETAMKLRKASEHST